MKYCFTSGDCDIYAIALHRIYGYPIYVVRGYYEEDNEEFYEDSHIVVKKPNGLFLDFNGENSEQDLKNNSYFENKIKYINIEEISEEEAKYTFSSENQEKKIKEVIDLIKNKKIKCIKILKHLNNFLMK